MGWEGERETERETETKGETSCTFGTVGGFVTSSEMVPGRSEVLGRHKSRTERMRYHQPFKGSLSPGRHSWWL